MVKLTALVCVVLGNLSDNDLNKGLLFRRETSGSERPAEGGMMVSLRDWIRRIIVQYVISTVYKINEISDHESIKI